MKKAKKQRKKSIIDQIKVARKASREEEIKMHGKPIRYTKIAKSKKVYDRKKNKADSKDELPYSFLKEPPLLLPLFSLYAAIFLFRQISFSQKIM